VFACGVAVVLLHDDSPTRLFLFLLVVCVNVVTARFFVVFVVVFVVASNSL